VLSATQVLEAVRPAIVSVEGLDRKRQVLSQGSGVVVGKNLVVTSWSLVSRASAIRIRQSDAVRGAVLDAVLEDAGLARLSAEVTSPIELGRDVEPDPQSPLFAAGLDADFRPSVVEGVASGGDGPDLIATSIPLAEGHEGGALLNPQGEMIGVVAAKRPGDSTVHSSPVRLVKDLLALPSGALPQATASPLLRLSAADRQWLIGFMAAVAREGQPLAGAGLDRVNALLDRLEPLVGAELAWVKVELGFGWLSHQRAFFEDAVEARAFRRVVRSPRRLALEKSLVALKVLTPKDLAEGDRIMTAIAAHETFDAPGARIDGNERWLAQMLSQTDQRRRNLETRLWEARNR